MPSPTPSPASAGSVTRRKGRSTVFKGYLSEREQELVIYIVQSLKERRNLSKLIDLDMFMALSGFPSEGSAGSRLSEISRELWTVDNEVRGKLGSATKAWNSKSTTPKDQGGDSDDEESMPVPKKSRKRKARKETKVAVNEVMQAEPEVRNIKANKEKKAEVAADTAAGNDNIGELIKKAALKAKYAAGLAALEISFETDMAALIGNLDLKKNGQKETATKVTKSRRGSGSAADESVGPVTPEDQMDIDTNAETTEVTDAIAEADDGSTDNAAV